MLSHHVRVDQWTLLRRELANSVECTVCIVWMQRVSLCLNGNAYYSYILLGYVNITIKLLHSTETYFILELYCIVLYLLY